MAGETETTTETQELPESTDVHGAARLMDGIADDGHETEERAGNAQEEGGDAVEAEEQETGEEGERQEDQEVERRETAVDDGPQFWDAADREAYKALPPEAKAVVLKYEQKRVQFEQQKNREAADGIKEARDVAHKLYEAIEQRSAWWQQNGPAFQQAFADRWSQVDWNKLAEENPAEWARLKQQRDNEATMLIEANRRGQADIAAANERAATKLQQAKQASHTEVAKAMPEHFGTVEKATTTYKALGDYLLLNGIDAERINAIHEAPIITMAMKAMLYDQAKKQASAVTAQRDKTSGKFTASTTPTRVAPGPTARAAGDQNGEARRRVGERFRKSGGASIADAAELIRLNDL